MRDKDEEASGRTKLVLPSPESGHHAAGFRPKNAPLRSESRRSFLRGALVQGPDHIGKAMPGELFAVFVRGFADAVRIKHEHISEAEGLRMIGNYRRKSASGTIPSGIPSEPTKTGKNAPLLASSRANSGSSWPARAKVTLRATVSITA